MKLLLSLQAALVVAGCHHAEPPPAERKTSVHCVPATGGPWIDHVELRGLVDSPPDKHAVVSAQVAGKITAIRVREGDVLAPGAVVADVEHAPFEDALRQTESQVTQADAAQKNAELVRDRARHLVDTGVGSQQALDDATARYDTAVAATTAARAAASSSQRLVRRSTVTSPIAGVVLRVFRRSGELVDGTSATPVVEIADPEAIELAATVGAADVARLARGQTARVRFSVLAGVDIAGIVRAAAPAVDPMTGLGVVRLTLAPGAARIPLGIVGEAVIATGSRSDVVSLPLGAIRTGPEGKPEALACEGAKAKALTIRTGARAIDRIEIREGVTAGMSIVAEAALGLEDGAPIEIVP